jgi:pimeloyl-ACP methyl ester carboxylesterase
MMISRTVELDGPVHYVDFGGTGAPIVLVHGLGGSHLNWLPVAPALTAHGHVYALDLGGHGRTKGARRRARIGANQRLITRFVEKVAGEPSVLFGNSMGGYLSLAVAAGAPDKVRALVLVDPAVPIPRGAKMDRRVLALFTAYTLPFVGTTIARMRARHGPEKMVRDTMALCCVDPSLIGRDVFDAHVALARERLAGGAGSGREFMTAQRSLMNRLLRRRRFYGMVAEVRARALILQGDRDRLVRIEAARALAEARPDWRLAVLEGVGHVPQLEVPRRFLEVVEPWLAAELERTSPRASAGA